MDDGVMMGEEAGEGQDLEASDLIATIDACAKEARSKRGDWIEEAKECYGMVAGTQWTPEELDALRKQRRPPVAYNLIEPVVNVVAGLEVTNRQEVKYLPREQGDSKKNEVLTGAAEWVRDECNAEDEDSEAFVDMVICGEGWTETRLDYEYDQDGMIIIERVDPLEILPDPASQKKNYKDAEYIIRERMVSHKWLKDTWPDKADELDVMSGDNNDSEQFHGESHHNVVGDQYAKGTNAIQSKSKKQVKLTEYQYKTRVPFYRIQDPQTGQVAELSVEEHTTVQANAKAAGMGPLKSVKQTKCVYRRAYKVGQVLLEDNEAPDPSSFTYHAMTAKRDRNKSCWYGLVRPMRDPQRWANKFFSQSMFIMNTNAKGGVVVEDDAVENMAKFEESWSQPDRVTVVKSGTVAAGKIQPKVPPPFPPELAKLMDFSISSIYRVSGVSPEMLGSVGHEQAAVLEYQRKQAGVTILATLFDALRKYRKEQGRSLLYLIQTYIADGRLIRIIGEKGQEYVPLLKEDGMATYDVIIDESPSSPNQKEKTWAILQGLLPMLMQAGINPPPELMEYLPLPQSLIDSMKNPDPQKVQEAQEAKKLDIAAKTADVQKTSAEAEKAKADADLKRAELQGQQVANADMFSQVMQKVQTPIGQDPQIAALLQGISQMGQVMAANVQQTQQLIQQNALQTQNLIGLMAAPNEVIRDPLTGAVAGTRKVLQ
jgi:hypothetical protein